MTAFLFNFIVLEWWIYEYWDFGRQLDFPISCTIEISSDIKLFFSVSFCFQSVEKNLAWNLLFKYVIGDVIV